MNTTIKPKLNTKLTTNEFNLLCNLSNGSLFNLEGMNWRDSQFDFDEIDELKSKWKVNTKILKQKLMALSALETLDLLTRIDIFWKIDASKYQTINKISPKQKISEILARSNRDDYLLWSAKDFKIEEVVTICQYHEIDYLIYIKDSIGHNKLILGIAEEHLMKYILRISEEDVFLRIQKLSDAILNDYFANYAIFE